MDGTGLNWAEKTGNENEKKKKKLNVSLRYEGQAIFWDAGGGGDCVGGF